MKKLFIIGNGFDCYAHRYKNGEPMKTKYSDFRDYIVAQYPDVKFKHGVPEVALTYDHHDYDYDEDEIIGYIIQVLDNCQGEKWSTLEEAIGTDIFSVFSYEFLDVDIDEEKDNEIFRLINANQSISIDIENAFCKLKELFEEWVSKSLGTIDYSCIEKKNSFEEILVGNPDVDKNDDIERLYLTFNYTETLEKVYRIDGKKVTHIHGKVGKEIYFGHGNTRPLDSIGAWGAEDSLESIRKYFLKDTNSAIITNGKFFSKLRDVTEIYSYGFSFSEVDMVYINEICKNIIPQNVTWYFNSYDTEHNTDLLELIKNKGFCVKTECRWDNR